MFQNRQNVSRHDVECVAFCENILCVFAEGLALINRHRGSLCRIQLSNRKFFHAGFSTTKPPPTCRASLGLENNEIPDSSITASSRYSYDYRASQGRLYQQGSWGAGTTDAKQWFQVDFVNWTRVTGVAIQGSTYSGWYRRLWVTRFKLFYSYDGVFFSDYREDGDNTKVLF